MMHATGPSATTLKHGIKGKEIINKKIAIDYGIEVDRSLYQRVLQLQRWEAPQEEVDEALQKLNEHRNLMTTLFGYWEPDCESGLPTTNKDVLERGPKQFELCHQKHLAIEEYIDFSMYKLGITRMHPQFDSHQWMKPYGFLTSKPLEHPCRVPLKDKLVDDAYLRLSLERGANASQIHDCKTGYCLKSVRKRVPKDKDSEDGSKNDGDKAKDSPVDGNTKKQDAEKSIGEDKSKKGKDEGKEAPNKPKYEYKRECRFGFPKGYTGFTAHYKDDETNNRYLDQVTREYKIVNQQQVPVHEDGAFINHEKGKILSIRNHERINR